MDFPGEDAVSPPDPVLWYAERLAAPPAPLNHRRDFLLVQACRPSAAVLLVHSARSQAVCWHQAPLLLFRMSAAPPALRQSRHKPCITQFG